MSEQKRRIRIVREENPSSPRNNDNLGTLVCWHRRHALGDEQPGCEPEAYLAGLPAGSIVIPVYLMDHSGLSLSVHDFKASDPSGWDSGQVGFIYCTPQKLIKEYGADNLTNRETATGCMKSEIEEYAQYLRGEVWGFVVEDWDGCEHCGRGERIPVDSCWGFIGETLEETGIGTYADGWATPEELEQAWKDRE